MKRLTAILLVLLLMIPCAHAEETIVTQTDMTGSWADAWSQRAMLEIERDDAEYVARVHWSNNAFEFVQWEMKGEFVNGVLETENCTKTIHSYAEDGTESIEILYENEKGALTYANGTITWTDSEGMGAECRFERMPAEEDLPAEESDSNINTLIALMIVLIQWAAGYAA